MRGGRTDRFFRRFLPTYLLVLLLPMALFAVTYLRTLQVYEEDAEEAHRAILRQTSLHMEGNLTAVEDFLQSVAMDARLGRLLNDKAPLSERGYALAVEAWESLQTRPVSGDLIASYFVHIAPLDYVLTRSTVYLSAERFYRHNFLQDGGGSAGFAAWRTGYLEPYHNRRAMPETRFQIRGALRPAIVFLQSLPLLAAAENRRGVLGIVLDRERLDADVAGILRFAAFRFLVGDAAGREILRVEQPEGAPARFPAVSSSYVSPTTGWRYEVAVPRSLVFARIRGLRAIAAAFAAVVLAAGLLLSLRFTSRIARPLRDVTALVGAPRDEEPLESLAAGVAALFHDNERLRREASERDRLLAEAVVFRLLQGEVRELDALGPSGAFPSDRGAYAALVAGPTGLASVDPAERIGRIGRFILVARDAVRGAIGSEGLCAETEPGRLAALLWAPAGPSAGAAARLEARIREVASACGAGAVGSLALGVGSTVDALTAVHRSYREAVECLGQAEHAAVTPSLVLYRYADMPRDPEGYWYPLEVETRLVNLTRAGRLAETQAAFDEVVQENLRSRSLGRGASLQLVREIAATLGKIGRLLRNLQLPVEEDGSEEPHAEGPGWMEAEMGRLRGRFARLCAAVDGARRSHNTALAEKLRRLVAERFQDPDLSLENLADHFRISPSHLSRFFKEQTGENFYAYLEGLRIEEAERLLQDDSLNVSEVGLRVGYRNDQSFRRAYKRRKGVSPRGAKRRVV